jgi:hypothetical protein
MKQVKNYEGLYSVNSKGEVYSHISNRLLKPANNGTGYYQTGLTKLGIRKKFYIHRLVWEAYNGIIPPHLEIDHSDEDKSNNRLDNLLLITRKGNMAKMRKSNPHVIKNLKNQ